MGMGAIDQLGLDILTAGQCPTCGKRGFVLGPRGGQSINIECANLKCRVRFNVATYGGRVLMAEAIETVNVWPSEPKVSS